MNGLALPAELTQAEASACLRALVTHLKSESAPAVVVNATALVRFDSSALAVLLELRREALAIGKTFAVQGLSTRLQNLAVLYGISDLMPVA